MISHSGQTSGQQSMLRLFPDRDIAFAVLLNGVSSGVIGEITNDLMRDLTGMDGQEPELDSFTLTANELAAYTGTFESFDLVYKVTIKETLIGSTSENTRPSLFVSCIAKSDNTESYFTWLPLDKRMFASYNSQGVRIANTVFISDANAATPNKLFVGGRLSHRRNSPAPFC